MSLFIIHDLISDSARVRSLTVHTGFHTEFFVGEGCGGRGGGGGAFTMSTSCSESLQRLLWERKCTGY